jgi:hypothetical protein
MQVYVVMDFLFASQVGFGTAMAAGCEGWKQGCVLALVELPCHAVQDCSAESKWIWCLF